MPDKKLGDRLKELRIEAKKTQEYMAKFLGLTRQGYAKYEKNESEPDLESLEKLSDFFDVSIDYLVRGESYRQTAERIVDDPEVRVAASDGEFTKEEKIKMLEWLLEAERGRKPGDQQPNKRNK
ncbi:MULTISPECIES: helix-turn-helix domain-containing protein [Bacillus]|uniref:HTH cro/C1-type domain-containing protein n=2 Tax=Bacillus TaxID=1386 RepID=A0A0M4G8Z2_9BACI|nr:MULTISPECIES: helix-turn-helix transcriptional regulator [Bacillus]ALC81758.1 hypothetical protein AM592_09170 [Bacillus gobiensis]MBP1080846.1 transcriptional regulator with XRE-family HTH domain [Bacillus capparidis]MED1097489.1 helix-turn-helix transcriptional regulator [Bacillus capparidis]